MEFKWMIVVILQTTFTMVICGRMVINDLLSRKESVKLDRETYFQKSHAIMSIQSEDGDIIDCIDIYKQSAFDHPALKDHKIQMNPSYDLEAETKKTETSRDSPVAVTAQTWHRSGSCPKGTIPVRRIKKNNSTKDSDYGRKKAMSFHDNRELKDNKTLYLLQQNHSLAILHAEGFAYLGAKGDIKVWNPHVESDDEYSTSQVALKIGSQADYEAIESGWAVDSSKETGCFDLTCPGFVQTSNEVALGSAIYPISNPTGLPWEITIYLHKDPNTSNWWVQYNEKINVGYWPADLFEMLSHHATTAQWGGEVYSSRVGTTPHTRTAMGNGLFPNYVMKNSGYMRRIRVLENNNIMRFPQWINIYSDEYFCFKTYYLTELCC